MKYMKSFYRIISKPKFSIIIRNDWYYFKEGEGEFNLIKLSYEPRSNANWFEIGLLGIRLQLRIRNY